MCPMICTVNSSDSSSKPLVKQCRVCGDVALGFNFNGLSCESCKAFFRRNAIKNKVYKCRRNDDCFIDKISRKYCKKCRLKKCYTIGMKKEMILSYKEELENEQKLLANIKLECSDEYSSNDDMKIVEYKENEENEDVNRLDLDIIRLRAYDLERLHEVQNAKNCFRDENKLELVGQADTLIEVMNLAELYVMKIIRFCKNFSAFKCLNLNDQMVMLKAFYPEIGAIGASFLYNPHKDGLPVIADSTENKTVFVKLDFTAVLKRKEIVTNFRRFLSKMQLEMENDDSIRDLILAQLLFSPRENLSCQEFLKYNHSVYCHLLRRYLQHKYGNALRAEEKYCSLMKMLNQINNVSQIFREVYLNEVDITKVARVLAEIYNLI